LKKKITYEKSEPIYLTNSQAEIQEYKLGLPLEKVNLSIIKVDDIAGNIDYFYLWLAVEKGKSMGDDREENKEYKKGEKHEGQTTFGAV